MQAACPICSRLHAPDSHLPKWGGKPDGAHLFFSASLREAALEHDVPEHMMPWFAQGSMPPMASSISAGDCAPLRVLKLNWDVK